jgi:hypothetical protein
MIVEATYVLCTSGPQTLDAKEARHHEKVYLIILLNLKF